MKDYILALDQGTTSSRAIIFDRTGQPVGSAQKEVKLLYPKAGWVEQEPGEIWATQMGVVGEVMQRTGISPQAIETIGITNQRETTLLWDRKTGKAAANAIGWQCRRTSNLCDHLKEEGWEPYVRKTTGLIIDAYFSATKIAWLLQSDPELKRRAKQGEICFGTVDSWLIWNLTKGEKHVTDVTNASRTMLFDINRQEWDDQLLKKLDIPPEILPEVQPSCSEFAKADPDFFQGNSIPIAGVAGDQQAALFGQACYHPGMAKNTYGTGCFMLMNTGNKPVFSQKGLLTTIAWSNGRETHYALEGSIFIAGAVIQWLRDEMNLIRHASETEAMALSVRDTNGVYVVPAFTGLGAPYWDMYARGAILGITRDTKAAHIVRAALESIAYQTRAVLDLMEEEGGIALHSLRKDGGAVANNFLMQFQADLLNRRVERAAIQETTALGAAYLAGLTTGFWDHLSSIEKQWKADYVFKPAKGEEWRRDAYQGWNKAVRRTFGWEK